MKKVAIQGTLGSYHDIAAHKYFEGEEIQLICCASFEEVFAAVKQDSQTIGMLAIENTIAGSLLHNNELLRQSGTQIVGEYKLRISHSFVCLPDEDWDDITEVNSHPIALMQERLTDIFVGMGFEILEGPEIEEAEYNFTKLNTSEGHPAREWSDTFYLTEDSSILLRTQTSPMQVRAMESKPLPIRMVAPGRVYRKDEVDARNTADQVVYQSEKTLNEMGDKVSESDKAPVLAAIEKLKEAQKGNDVAAIKAATDEVQKAFYAVSEKLYKNAAPQGDPNAAAGAAGNGPQNGAGDDGVVDADYEEVK